MVKKEIDAALLGPDDVASLLGVARKTVIIWAREGRIPSVRIGRFYRFDRAELDAWMRANRTAR